MIYGYIRVSSDKQTVENQRFEINNFCRKNNFVIDGWIEESISDTKTYNKTSLGLSDWIPLLTNFGLKKSSALPYVLIVINTGIVLYLSIHCIIFVNTM